MNLQNEDLTTKEPIKVFTTPKFRKVQVEKDNNSKNNSIGFEVFSFNESNNDQIKISSKNNQQSPLNNKEEIKESKDGLIFKENFSLSSLLNNCNNSTTNKNNNDENKEKKNENSKALISFCEKNGNSFNNEIIYKEKDNSSNSTNKDKEESNLKINSFTHEFENIEQKKEDNKKKEGGNSNINYNNIKYTAYSKNTNENKKIGVIQYDSSSFKYNLPLEKDNAPSIKGFFDYGINNNNYCRIMSINKSLDLNNNNIFEKKVGDRLNKFDIKNNDLSIKKYNFTYSKKKVKRKNTEGINRNYKIESILPIENINICGDEIIRNKNLIEKGINKITIKKNILHSSGNYKKIKKKIKKSDTNTSFEKNKEEKEEELFHSERTNFNTMSPKKRLNIIIKKAKINLNIDNKNSKENCFSAKEKLVKENIHFPARISLNNSIKPRKSIDSFSTNQKESKYKTSLDFHNTLFNFKIKNLIENEENDISNLSKEKNKLKKDINIINISNKENTKQELGVYKKGDKKLINNKEFNNNIRTRNTSNLYLSKVFNGVTELMNNNIIFNSITYDDTLNNDLNNNIFLHTQENPKLEIKTSLLSIKKPLKHKYKFTNKEFIKGNIKLNLNNNNYNLGNKNKLNINKNISNKNVNYNKLNKFKNDQNLFHKIIKKQRNKNYKTSNNSTFTKTYNSVFNNTHTKIKIIKKESKNLIENNNNNNNGNDNYNKLICNTTNSISHCNTDRYIKRNHESIKSEIISNKANISNFINMNSSTNSLTNKIKVNMLKKISKTRGSTRLSSHSKKNNNYWKIYKKPKNCCLLNKFSHDFNKSLNRNQEFNHKNKGNSQFVIFRKNKPLYLKENNNSSSSNMTNNYFSSLKNDYNSINGNISSSQSKHDLHISQALNNNKIYKNSNKINKNNKIFAYKNKSNEVKEIKNYNDFNFSEDIIKLSILRNNLNNKIIKEFSVVVGEGEDEEIKKKENNINGSVEKSAEIKFNKNKNKEEDSINSINKKTIINVNQYYPSYFINSKK